MGRKFHFIAWLTVIYFACVARSAAPMGFIFPPNATASDPPLDNMTVHFNDNIVVEYTASTGGIVLLGQDCFATSESVSEGSESQTLYLSSSYNDTGTLLWNVGNGNDGNYTDINYCRLTLMNFTITACSWGPFGLLSFDQVVESNYTLYSAMFKIMPPNNTETATIRNPAKTASQSPKPITATASGKAVCPPSGIPPAPAFSPVAQVDMYPKMAPGLEFPPP